mgnify:CR=1 FL=1
MRCLPIPFQYREEIFNIFTSRIKKDININAKDTFGFTPLFYAENVQMAQLLLDHGANINARGLSGENVLSLFCKFTDEEMVEFYIKKEIDVNAKIGVVNAVQNVYPYSSSPEDVLAANI